MRVDLLSDASGLQEVFGDVRKWLKAVDSLEEFAQRLSYMWLDLNSTAILSQVRVSYFTRWGFPEALSLLSYLNVWNYSIGGSFLCIGVCIFPSGLQHCQPFSRLERQPSNPDHKSGMTGKGVSAGGMTDFPDLPILFRAGPNNRSSVAVFDVVVPVMLIA